MLGPLRWAGHQCPRSSPILTTTVPSILAVYLACAPSLMNAAYLLSLLVGMLSVERSNLMSQKDCTILCWNVSGLNVAARRVSVYYTVHSTGTTIVCLQETKIVHWMSRLVSETLGQPFTNNYAMLPAKGTMGGILIAANDNHCNLHNTSNTNYTVSTTITMKADNNSWTLTGVYGP